MDDQKRRNPYTVLTDSDTSSGEEEEETQLTLPQSPVPKPAEISVSKHSTSPTSDILLKSLRNRKKRKATLSPFSPDPKIIWSKQDELAILKGIVDYRNEKGVNYTADSFAFIDFIKDEIEAKFSKDQLMRKIRKMKQRFRNNLSKGTTFNSISHDSEIFNLANTIWRGDEGEGVDWSIYKGSGSKSKSGSKGKALPLTFVEDVVADGDEDETDGKENEEHEGATNAEMAIWSNEEDSGTKRKSKSKSKSKVRALVEEDEVMADDEAEKKDGDEKLGGKESEEPKDVNGTAKDDSCDEKLPYENVDKQRVEEVGGGVDDELCALHDALETTLFQNSSTCAKKLMVEKLKTLGAKEKEEFSNEWKALLVQEVLLKSKKQAFSAKLASAAFK